MLQRHALMGHGSQDDLPVAAELLGGVRATTTNHQDSPGILQKYGTNEEQSRLIQKSTEQHQNKQRNKTDNKTHTKHKTTEEIQKN